MKEISRPGLPEKVERNQEIYKKKMSGMTYRQLSIDYDLSINRLQQIVNRLRKQQDGYTA